MGGIVSNRESRGTVGDSCQVCHRASCEPDVIAITATQPSRGYALDLSEIDTGQATINILARSDKPRKVKVDFSGECTSQKKSTANPNSYIEKGKEKPSSKCPAVKVSNTSDQQDHDESFLLELTPERQDTHQLGLSGFLDRYLLPNALKEKRYFIRSQLCSGQGQKEAVINVLPESSWKGEVKLGIDRMKRASDLKASKFSLEITGDLELNIDTETWKFSGESEKDWKETFKAIFDFINPFLEFVSDADRNQKKKTKNLAEAEIVWPCVGFGGAMEVYEPKGNPSLDDMRGNIHLSFDPLIRVNAKIKILDTILRAKHPITFILSLIKKTAADGIKLSGFEASGTVGIDLSLSGGIEGVIAWKKEADQGWTQPDGKIKADVTINLEGRAEGHTRFFAVKYGAGAKLHTGSPFNADQAVGIFGRLSPSINDTVPGVNGQLVFTGLAIYQAQYAEAGGEDIVTSSDALCSAEYLKKDICAEMSNQKLQVSKKTEVSERINVLLEPRQWPPGVTTNLGNELL